MINFQTLLSFAPLILIVLLSLSLFALLSAFLKDKSFFSLLSVFLTSPLFIGLFLYLLFFIFPGHAKIFYILTISLPIFLLAFFARKNLFLSFRVIREKWQILKAEPLNLFLKIILSAIFFIFILVLIRALFWPINFADQISYLKQAYVFAQTRSLDLFLNWGFFHDSNIYSYQMNPAIRPGLPMIFTTTFLFDAPLQTAQIFCQTIIFYYFLLTSSVVFYVSWKIAKQDKLKSALVALFLMLFTYHFVYLSIEGFKELLIIPITILVLFYISNQEKLLVKLKPWIYIGIMTGLIAFVNYSGVLITLFVLLILILTKGLTYSNITITAKILLLAIIFSGFEFFAFSNLIAPSFFTYIFHKEQSISIDTNNIIGYSPAAQSEFAGYGINSLGDLYLKGKSQGFFQIQYFGLIFILFAIVTIATYKKLMSNYFTKNILLFLAIYGFVFFDPLNINRSEFAYVLSISHKYWALLVPFVAIIIASQFDWINKITRKINPNILITSLSSFFILDLIFFKNNPDRLFRIISTFVPILNSPDYYIRSLELLNSILLIILASLIIFLAYFYMTKRKILFLLFENSYTIATLFLFIFFVFPFLFFYNSNFNLKNTFVYSFSGNSTKLEKIPGWEDMYLPLKSLDELPKDKRILFIDQPIGLINIHLNLSMSNVYQLSTLPDNKDLDAIRKMDISYVYAKNNSKLNNQSILKINNLEIIKRVGDNLIFEVKP